MAETDKAVADMNRTWDERLAETEKTSRVGWANEQLTANKQTKKLTNKHTKTITKQACTKTKQKH